MKKIWATTSYSVLQAAMWGFFAVSLGFSSNFLYHFGFQDHQISLLLGICLALSCVLQLGLAELISRWKRLSVFAVLLGMGILMLLGCLAMLAERRPALAVGGLGLTVVMVQSFPAMGNAVGMDAIEKGSPTNYSFARGMGSVGYGLTALLTGFLVERWGTRAIPLLAVALTAIFLTAVLWYHFTGEVRDGVRVQKEKQPAVRGNFLKAHPQFALFLMAAVLLLISQNLLSNFMLQIMTAKGGGAAEQGTATFIAAVTELPLIFCFPLLLKWLRCEKWVGLSTVFFVVKAVGTFAATGCYGVYAAQTTQLLGFGLFSIASVHYAEQAVGKGEAVRAQSYLSSATSVGALAAMSSGGVLCKFLGVQNMVLSAGACAVLGMLLALLAIHLGQKRRQHETV